MRQRRTHLVPAGLVAMAVLAAACGGPRGGSGSTAGQGSIVAGIVAASASDPFDARLLEGARARAGEPAGAAESPVRVTLVERDPAGDLDRQLAQMGELIEQKVSGIVLHALDPGGVAEAVTRVEEAGIPVVTVGQLINVTVTGHVGYDEFVAGQVAADWLGQRLSDGDQVAVLTGPPDSLTADRVSGFEETVAATGAFEVVAVEEAGTERAAAADAAGRLLREHGDLAAIFAETGALALGAADAVASAGRTDVLVLGVGLDPEALEAVREGRLAALAVPDARRMGATALDLVVLSAQGREIDPYVGVDPIVVTQENVADFLREK